MAASGEFIEIPYVLTSPYATLTLNAATGDRYILLNGGCEMGAEIRSTSDPVPQADGTILHHRFFTGYAAKLAMQLWYNDDPACGADLVRMIDTLNGVCWSLLNAGDNEGRLSWTPTGQADRMIDDVRLAERMTIIAPDTTGPWTVHFGLDAALPYAQDLTQTSTALGATISNGGTAEYWPVFRIGGGSSAFTLTNVTTGLKIEYDASLPGGIATGAFGVEIDTFRNTAYLITGSVSGPGNGADAMGSINMLLSDFWSLKTGSNVITLAGATGSMLWQNAWA